MSKQRVGRSTLDPEEAEEVGPLTPDLHAAVPLAGGEGDLETETDTETVVAVQGRRREGLDVVVVEGGESGESGVEVHSGKE